MYPLVILMPSEFKEKCIWKSSKVSNIIHSKEHSIIQNALIIRNHCCKNSIQMQMKSCILMGRGKLHIHYYYCCKPIICFKASENSNSCQVDVSAGAICICIHLDFHPREHNKCKMKWRPMGGMPVHLIPSVMRKISRLFGNVVSCVSFVLISINELWFSKPTITVSREGGAQQGLTSQLSLTA